MPFFSIIIPLYNKQKDIAATLKSVFTQTYADYEVIVVNDGSTDGSEGEVLQFNDPRLKYHKTENRGVSQARNTGIEKASGKIMAFLDADDYWLPNHLETIFSLYTQYPNVGLYATNYSFIYPNGKVQLTDFSTLGKSFSGVIDNPFRHSLKDRMMWTSCVAVKKEAFEKTGKFDTSITLGAGEDTDMWIRIALKYPVAFTTKVTAHYNLAGSNRISHSHTLMRSFAKFDKFSKEEAADPHLKKYLDLYRSVYALAHKMAGDEKTAQFYLNNLDTNNIALKSAILLRMPAFVLRALYRIKQILKRINIHVDPYA